jgi:hypothetical protein
MGGTSCVVACGGGIVINFRFYYQIIGLVVVSCVKFRYACIVNLIKTWIT